MKVLFVIPYPVEIASTRQRVFQFFPYLAEHGVQCVASSFVSSEFYGILYAAGNVLDKIRHTIQGCTSRVRDLRSASDYDLVFVHREAFPFFTTVVERRLASKLPLVYDFDDAIYLMNPTKPSLLPLLRNPAKVKTILGVSSCVIVGNEHLAAFAKDFNSNVHIIPTCIDTNYYLPRGDDNVGTQKLVVGWIGSRSTVPYLLSLKNVLLNLSKRYEFAIKIVSNEDLDLGLPKIFKQWSLMEELSDLHSFDIGIMPLPDNKWTRGKCGYKIIQYMAVGKPVIASSVGVNAEIIVDGYNGYLAKSPNDWNHKLSRLIENKSIRDTFGARGRTTVEEKYSLAVNAPKLLTILKNMCAVNKWNQ
ncbi:MAG: glycosyltransferase family 4 protein [candidate division WOR-3 bacterium]|nr:MAG: glycosyltransferase family 4 protein [candidate division WOR-3 bacterium]